MEAPELFHAGFCLAGTPHCSPEKVNGGGEQFVVEDLLDFSNEEAGWMIAAAGEVGSGSNGAAGNSTDSSTVTVVDSYCDSSLSACDHKHTLCRSTVYASLSGEFCEPPQLKRWKKKRSYSVIILQNDAMAELTKLEHEWALSDVVNDSFSREELHKLRLINGVNSTASSSSATTIVAVTTFLQDGQISTFCPDVPGKARSKRSRVAPGNWSSRLLVLSPSEADAPSPDSELIVPLSTAAPKKVTKKKEPSESAAASDGRRCLHCQTNKTPQWRTGPMGPKTLCNACGVRFKSGRLVPEYRPAASPTFVVSKHSNSHRKVLELRRQKEFQQQLTSPATALYDPPQAALPSGFLIPGPDIRHLI